jgi:Family of unknown function (DUF6459)
MPSSILTPDPPTAPGQRTPPEPLAPPGQRTPPELLAPLGDTPLETLAPPDHPTPSEPPASPGLRLVTVPAGWPPYDCESHGAACPVAREAATANPHISRRVPAPARASGPTAPSPAPGQATALPRQFAQVIVEILAGSRPLRQTVGWTTDRVRAQIGDLTQLVASEQRPRIRRIVASQPAASVVEMTVVISFGPRSRALAMRFEHMPARQPAPGRPARPARWLCTEIETG